MSKVDWTEVDSEVVKEILREAEEYLKAQLQAAIASDQRAVRVAGTLSAGLSAILVACIAWLSTNGWHWPVIAFMTSLMLGFGYAVALLLRSSSPITFFFAGNAPKEWFNPIDLRRPIKESMGEQAEHYSEMIVDNNTAMTRNGLLYRRALKLVIVTPILSLLTALAVSAGPAAVALVKALV